MRDQSKDFMQEANNYDGWYWMPLWGYEMVVEKFGENEFHDKE